MAFRPVPVLQWGRVLMNAETAFFNAAMDAARVLQWGRVLMNAETRIALGSEYQWPLASMGPRSHERGNLPGSPGRGSAVKSLQWGRVLMNAETERRNVRTVAALVASMGPRSHERGNR